MGLRGQLYCHRCVPLGFCLRAVRKFQACGVVRYSTHEGGKLQPSSWPCGSGCQVRGYCCASLSAFRSMVRLSSKTTDLNVVAPELAVDAVLDLCSVGLPTHIPFPTDYLRICRECGTLSHKFYRSLLGACHGSRLQIGIVGSGRPPLRSTGTEHWQGSSYRRGGGISRVSHAVFLVVALLALCLIGSSRSPGPAHCMPPKHTWVHRLPVRHGTVSPQRHRPTPVQPALQPTLLCCQSVLNVLPWLPTAEGANDRRLVLPVTRKHSARSSVSSRVVSTRS